VSFGEGKKPFSGLMITGILAGIIILIDFHGFWILLSLLFSYIGITKFKLKEFLIIVLFSFFIRKNAGLKRNKKANNPRESN
jgi:hypothetical protein